MPDFTLTAAGGPVSLSDFRDQYVFLYFGYTCLLPRLLPRRWLS